MEHISRLTTNNIDLLLIVSDGTRRGILSASRISDLTEELNVNIGKKLFVINQVNEDQFDALKKIADEHNLVLAGIIPEDKSVKDFDFEGRPTIELDDNNSALKSAYKIFDEVIIK